MRLVGLPRWPRRRGWELHRSGESRARERHASPLIGRGATSFRGSSTFEEGQRRGKGRPPRRPSAYFRNTWQPVHLSASGWCLLRSWWQLPVHVARSAPGPLWLDRWQLAQTPWDGAPWRRGSPLLAWHDVQGGGLFAGALALGWGLWQEAQPGESAFPWSSLAFLAWQVRHVDFAPAGVTLASDPLWASWHCVQFAWPLGPWLSGAWHDAQAATRLGSCALVWQLRHASWPRRTCAATGAWQPVHEAAGVGFANPCLAWQSTHTGPLVDARLAWSARSSAAFVWQEEHATTTTEGRLGWAAWHPMQVTSRPAWSFARGWPDTTFAWQPMHASAGARGFSPATVCGAWQLEHMACSRTFVAASALFPAWHPTHETPAPFAACGAWHVMQAA